MLKYFALILQKINKYNFTAFQNQIGISLTLQATVCFELCGFSKHFTFPRNFGAVLSQFMFSCFSAKPPAGGRIGGVATKKSSWINRCTPHYK